MPVRRSSFVLPPSAVRAYVYMAGTRKEMSFVRYYGHGITAVYCSVDEGSDGTKDECDASELDIARSARPARTGR